MSAPLARRPALVAVGIGAAYLVAARLALLLALPPGYATAVWPAAGLALAGVLLWGPRVWPGIALGSFLANAWTALAAPGDAAFETTLAVPLALAAGAALQAVAGAALVRRLAGAEASSPRRSPLRLVLAGGPLSCLISATIGVGALLVTELLAPADAAFSWFTWWAGDSIGVVVFTPLCLVWADRRLARRRKVSISLPVAVTFVLVVALYVAASSWEQRRLDAELDRRCALVLEAIDGAIDGYVDALHAMRGLFDSSERVTRREFGRFAADLAVHHRHVEAFSWSERVPVGARAAWEEAMRREGGAPRLAVAERDAHGRFVPAARRDEYLPISFIEPLAENVGALGFDVASDPARRAALARARDRNEAVATAHVTLVQHGAPRAGVVLYLPVYHRGASPATVEQRREALRGYVGVGLFVPRVIAGAVKGQAGQGLTVAVVDEEGATPTTLFDGRAGGAAPAAAAAPNPDRRLPLDVGGRRWTVRLSAATGGAAAPRSLQAWTLLAAGLLFAGLLGVHLLETAQRLTTVEELVGERTAELDRASAGLRHHNDILAAVAASAEQLFHAASWEEVVVEVLGRLGAAFGVTRISIFEVVAAGGEPAARYRFGWQAPDVEPIDMTGLQDVPVRMTGFARWFEAVGRGETVHGPASGFPEPERLQLERQGTRSIAVVPVQVGERFWGFLGFDDCRVERSWSEGDLLALHVAADTLGAAIGDKERDRLLQASERRYRTIIEDSPAYICTHSLSGELLSVNPAAAEALGRPAAEIVGRNLADFLAPEIGSLVGDFLAALAERGVHSGSMTVATAGGEQRLWQFSSRVIAEPGEVPYAVGHAVDVTHRRQLELFLREQAFTDPLTGAANRALFADRLQHALDQAERHGRLGTGNQTLAVAVLDLDCFKAINDELGHAAGDAVLREVATRLRSAVRMVDTVARLGGDEFALVLPEIGAPEDARRLAEKLMAALRQPFAYEGTPLDFSVSLGFSLFPADADSAAALTVQADAAMYEAKQAGKNLYRFWRG